MPEVRIVQSVNNNIQVLNLSYKFGQIISSVKENCSNMKDFDGATGSPCHHMRV
jgi:hypothetical protein